MSAELTDSGSRFSVREIPGTVWVPSDEPAGDGRGGDRGLRPRLARCQGAGRRRSWRGAERRLVTAALRGRR
jgi:hypothetical protein